MGIFDALTNAVSGLQAQSYALGNISGNIANSSTTAYKRTDTAFQDLVIGSTNAAASKQTSGSVLAFSRATNDLQGTVSASSSGTSIAVDGDGYLLVQASSGSSNGTTTFSGNDLYTRRGDFTLDKNGNLKNGAGYYLMGRAVSATGSTSSTPTVIDISSSSVYPAAATTSVTYKTNLPQTPKTDNYVEGVASSSLLDSTLTSSTTITGATDVAAFNASSISGGSISVYDSNGAPQDLTLRWAKTSNASTGATTLSGVGAVAGTYTGGTLTINGTAVTIPNDATSTQVKSAIDAAGITGLTVTDTAGTLGFSLTSGALNVTASSAGLLDNLGLSAAGGTDTTVAGVSGNTSDSWALYYQSSGSPETWQRVDTDAATAGSQGYTFQSGVMTSPASGNVTLTGLTLNGFTIGDVTIKSGTTGLTQYNDSSGVVSTPSIVQDGVASGELTSVSITDGGSVTAAYSNGRTRTLYKVPVANFAADDQLKHLDGGAFAATEASGAATISDGASIVGSALEASNVDISDEFTKMIVTQQAYSANTKVVTTANDMMQSTLSMIR